MKIIPLGKPFLTGRELAYARDAVRSGKLSGVGPYTLKCQALLERALGARKALLTTSCTGAMEMASLLLDLKPGDEVILPSFTFPSTANAVMLRGARPVFVDVRADTMNMDERLVEAKVTERTRAIFPVHYAGVACEMDAILAVARRRRLAVVEDAAQALGARYKGRALGTLGDFGCFSFHDTKNLTCGEGGALLVNDERSADRAEVVWEKGTDARRFARREVDKYTWREVGGSFALSDVLAAFLLAQLERMGPIGRARKKIYDRYARELAGLREDGFLETPVVPPGVESNHHIYHVLLRDEASRDALIRHLKDAGISAAFHYVPLHLSPMGRTLGWKPGDLPVTEDAARRLVRLPLFNGLAAADQARVIASVRGFFRRRPAGAA